MAYIGTTPTSGDFVLLDSITTSATASYTMQKNSVNFEAQSANHIILSLNGTIQAPVSSFTVSGSTLTFASALTSSDVIDFILVLGNVNDVGTATTVVDSAITKNKLNLISESSSAGLTVKGDGSSENGTIQLNCSQNSHGIKLKSPAHSAGASYTLTFPTTDGNADEFLKTDGSGVLSWATAGGGNTPIFQATMSGSQSYSNNTSTKVDFDTEQFDTAGAYDHTTNQRFTVPSGQAGKYFIYAKIFYDDVNSTDAVRKIHIYKNGSNAGTGSKRTVGTTGRDFTVEACQVYDLSVGDYIEIYLNTNAGSGTINGSANNDIFGGFKLGE